ncbi:MAG TPA: LysR family transcriptional regulator [Caulobacteraceae bacterium]
MHISRVDLNLLVVLETIYAEEGITKAAERLHLTQPAVSHALSRLRDLFEDPLFERQGYKMVPTPLTRRLMGPLRESLQGIGSLLNDVQAFEPALAKRRYVVGLRDYMESTVMPPMMRALSAEGPQMGLSTVRIDRQKMEGELAAGALDLAVDMLLPVSEQVMHARVHADTMAVVARAGHPATRDGRLDLDGYLAHRHVLVTSRRSGLGFEDVELRRMGLQRRVALRCQFHFAACRAVSQTDLLLTMPASYATIANQPFGNQVLPFPAALPPYDAYMYWHASTDNDPANRWLRELMLRSFLA